MGKTHSKPSAARHGREMAWARYGHGMLCVNRPLNSLWKEFCLQKPTGQQLPEVFHSFQAISKVINRVFQKWQNSIVTLHFGKIHFNIVTLSVTGLQSERFPSDFQRKILCAFPICTAHATCSAKQRTFDFINWKTFRAITNYGVPHYAVFYSLLVPSLKSWYSSEHPRFILCI
jgi:hypothetical protein